MDVGTAILPSVAYGQVTDFLQLFVWTNVPTVSRNRVVYCEHFNISSWRQTSIFMLLQLVVSTHVGHARHRRRIDPGGRRFS